MEQIYTHIDVAKESFVAATSLAGKVTTTLHHNDKKGIAGFGVATFDWREKDRQI